MLFMVIEQIRGGEAAPVYRRLRARDRLAPEGVRYVSSWVTSDLRGGYQVMECADRQLLEAWMDEWQDLVEFEVFPVMTSVEAVAVVAPQL